MTISDNSKQRAGSSAFWTGASAGLAGATIFVCALAGYFVLTGIPRILEAVVAALLGTAIFLVLLLAARLVTRGLRRVPVHIYCVAAAGIGTLYVSRASGFGFGWPSALFYPAALLFLTAVAILAGVYWASRHRAARGSSLGALATLAVGAVVVLVAGLAWILDDGRDPFPVEMAESNPPSIPIAAPNPSEPGPFEVETLTYGSGTDKRRPAFGEGVAWKTEPVDASKMLPDWKDFKARARGWYWGISIEKAPLNARVWAPTGDAGGGPFPLVLVVHGNHGMEDHSDAGYAYLGELLASRGFIVASIDENYINGTWSGDFRGKEMPMRAWLLLEHLRLWHAWNRESGHRFYQNVDTDNIALMGHSRGGEAVSVAYAFNGLSHYPEDATVRFDYGYSIRALVAIAQTDRHYPRRVELANVNFLTLQGSYDSDEASSFGMRQFRRIRLDREPYRFKAGVYIHGANHGQFNTTWGMDSGPPYSWLLNRAALISGEDQRQVAKVYISAFLEATLRADERYLPLFRDPRAGSAFLPDDVITVAQYEDSTFTTVADFDEDLDVTTASLDGARIETKDLALWREEELRFRDDLTQGTNAVVIGSNGEKPGNLTIRFGGTHPPANGGALSFFLSASPENVPAADDLSAVASAKAEPDASDDDDDEAAALVLRVELEDADGKSQSVALADVAPIVPPLKVQFLKLEGLNRRQFPNDWEPTFQHYEIPLERFGRVDATRLAAIRFHADGAGVVILDAIGFRGGSAVFPSESVELVSDVN